MCALPGQYCQELFATYQWWNMRWARWALSHMLWVIDNNDVFYWTRSAHLLYFFNVCVMGEILMEVL